MAQADFISQEKAWQKIYKAFQSTELSVNKLIEEPLAQSSIRWGNKKRANRRLRIYWSGALMFLRADIALRKQSNNKIALNDILLKLNQCCINGNKIWRGSELATQLDQLSSSLIFSELYRSFSNGTDFPDYVETFAQLGIQLPSEKNKELKFNKGSLAESIME